MAVWTGQARADAIPPFHVSGQVTDGSGAPLQDVFVILYRNTITPDVSDPWFAADDEYADSARLRGRVGGAGDLLEHEGLHGLQVHDEDAHREVAR